MAWSSSSTIEKFLHRWRNFRDREIDHPFSRFAYPVVVSSFFSFIFDPFSFPFTFFLSGDILGLSKARNCNYNYNYNCTCNYNCNCNSSLSSRWLPRWLFVHETCGPIRSYRTKGMLVHLVCSLVMHGWETSHSKDDTITDTRLTKWVEMVLAVVAWKSSTCESLSSPFSLNLLCV